MYIFLCILFKNLLVLICYWNKTNASPGVRTNCANGRTDPLLSPDSRLGYKRIREERSDDSEAKPRWLEAPETPGWDHDHCDRWIKTTWNPSPLIRKWIKQGWRHGKLLYIWSWVVHWTLFSFMNHEQLIEYPIIVDYINHDMY